MKVLFNFCMSALIASSRPWLRRRSISPAFIKGAHPSTSTRNLENSKFFKVVDYMEKVFIKDANRREKIEDSAGEYEILTFSNLSLLTFKRFMGVRCLSSKNKLEQYETLRMGTLTSQRH